ncbi:MAG TPA: hypothetical protein VN175_09725, partial [Rhizomicrobium sp.]|nr:hypothetical protein [Rhizomicrobium sp.]
GTVLGDLCEHVFGDNVAVIGLTVLLAVVLLAYRNFASAALASYWLTVAVARTTGTAIGDWLAESPIVSLGLPLSTLITGASLAAVLILWRGPRPKAVLAETPA